jgi:hypothetical protein
MDVMERIRKAQFLRYFLLKYPEFYLKMRECEHAYSAVRLNPFHLENDLWTHTVLVFNSLRLINDSDMCPEKEVVNKALLIAALTHDWGKLATRAKDDTKCRVSFYSHATASTQFTIDVAGEIYKNDPDKEKIIYYAAFVVSRHMDAYQIFSPTVKELNPFSVFKFCNYNVNLIHCLDRLLEADENGQITNVEEEEKKDPAFRKQLFSEAVKIAGLEMKDPGEYDLEIFMCSGAPGSGKDTIARRNNAIILSYDNIRIIDYLTSRDSDKSKTMPEIYSDAWRWVRSNGIEVEDRLQEELKVISGDKSGRHIYICNVLSTSNVRKRMINKIKQTLKNKRVKVTAVHVSASRATMEVRDLSRNEKHVGADVISGICGNISIPSCYEGFDSVTFVWNEGDNV